MPWERKPQFVTVEQAIKKLERYCSYQERSQKQVIEKLKGFGLIESERGEVLIHLIQNNFLNEERFALAYAQGKFKIKRWGPDKIKRGLMQAGVSNKLINQAINELPSREVQSDQIKELGLKKLKITEEDLIEKTLDWDSKNKLYRFLVGKGYTFEEIKRVFP
ncbi:MAG: regulatory protein RecX [Bacteroidia bacterium]|jgi:regulatory protein|nr:regulatory protein RecX [Bacteroidia bacterium]